MQARSGCAGEGRGLRMESLTHEMRGGGRVTRHSMRASPAPASLHTNGPARGLGEVIGGRVSTAKFVGVLFAPTTLHCCVWNEASLHCHHGYATCLVFASAYLFLLPLARHSITNTRPGLIPLLTKQNPAYGPAGRPSAASLLVPRNHYLTLAHHTRCPHCTVPLSKSPVDLTGHALALLLS